MGDSARFCRHLVEVSNTRLGGATWCRDCGLILGRTHRDFPREMFGSTPPVDRPEKRREEDRVRPGGTIHLRILRRSWLMGLRMTKERYREKRWPEFVEQMEEEGAVIV